MFLENLTPGERIIGKSACDCFLFFPVLSSYSFSSSTFKNCLQLLKTAIN
uniref:Uncharacterized protein n=1 Tax=Rhizophora mucronata TaxID=61149 RepID=A0A2P2MYT5_RHIMU